jgi:hypothetical protein
VTRVISSAQTFFAEFVVPIIVVAVLAPALSVAGSRAAPVFAPVGALLILSIYWYYIRLKKVAIDSDGLIVSNYFREVRVPWRNILEVSGSRWVNTRQVKVTFDRDIGFGRSIVFMPTFRLLWPGQEHPIAHELRDLILVHREP